MKTLTKNNLKKLIKTGFIFKLCKNFKLEFKIKYYLFLIQLISFFLIII